MDIIIPTYGRAAAQTTLEALPRVEPYDKIILVVQDREKELYAKYDGVFDLRVLPPAIQTIAHTRQWILEYVGTDDKMLMLDDDLTFFKRRKDDLTKFEDTNHADIYDMFYAIDHRLSNFAHVGVAAREGGNRITDKTIGNTRIMRVLGYRRDILVKENIRFDVMEVMEDFYVALALLKEGYPNLVENQWCHNQAGSGREGGCSAYRTPELQEMNAHALADFHEPYVRVVEKTTKTAWGGGTRTDVVISWKKAFEDGASKFGTRILDTHSTNNPYR